MGTLNASSYSIATRGLIVALALVTTQAFAQSKKAAKSAPAPQAAQESASAPTSNGATTSNKKDDKVDISDLENKYWAPKDTDFSVVQNRTYTKEHRWFLTAEAGRPVNDAWSNGNIYGLTGNYFFNERMGVQATWLRANLRNNEAADKVATYGSGISVDHNRFATYYGVGFNVVPFYAKMSFWGKKIIYFDMAFTPTIGMTNYDQQVEGGIGKTKGALTYGIDVTQYFFFTNYFALRMDLKNQWHSEDIMRFHNYNGIKTGEKVKDQMAQDTLFLLGLTFFY